MTIVKLDNWKRSVNTEKYIEAIKNSRSLKSREWIDELNKINGVENSHSLIVSGIGNYGKFPQFNSEGY